SLPWTQVQGGDGGFVRVDPVTPTTVYHTFASDGPGFIERSMDGGATWTDISAGINPGGNEPSLFYVPYQLDQSNPNRLVLGTNHLYETLNHGNSWHATRTPAIAGLAIDNPTHAHRLSQSLP